MTTNHPLGPGAGLRVLVVEDHEINRRVALRLLERLGCTAEAVADGRLAVRAAGRVAFDLVLMGLELPGMGGLEAAGEIRRREADLGRPRAAILAMTEHDPAADPPRLREAGVDGHLARPVTHAALVAALATREARGRAARPIDRDALSGRCGGDEAFLRDLLASFRQAVPASLAALRRALDAGDAPAAARAAHGLKGIAMTVAADALAGSSAELEAAALAAEPARARDALRRVLAAWDAVLPELVAGAGADPGAGGGP